MRGLLSLLLTGAVLFATLVPAGSAGLAESPPRRAAERRSRIADARHRIDGLKHDVGAEAALAIVRAYRRFTPDQLADPDRKLSAERLLDIVKDESVKLEIREEASENIVWDRGQQKDPRLEPAGKGWARPRAAFSKKVLPLLVDKEQDTRGLAKKILDGLWPGANTREPEIAACNARLRHTCSAARVAWEKFLSK